MVKSIIKGVSEELGELVKETGREVVVNQPKEVAKSLFPEMINATGMKQMNPEEQAKKTAEDEVEKKAAEARLRSILHSQQQRPAQGETQEPTVFEKQKREQLLEQERKAKQLQEEEKNRLPTMSQRSRRGSAFAVRKRQQAHVEMGKTPGQ